MPVITASLSELSDMSKTETDELLELLPKMAVEVEKVVGDEVWLEVYPDRCDMLSVEGMARAVRGYTGVETGITYHELGDTDITTHVELSVQDVRPYIVTAVVKDVSLDDRVLRSLMNVQEKLHLTLGRGREKVAIGVHDLSKVKPPFTYKAVSPTSRSFVPLQYHREMTLEEILEKHDKGKEYAHILDGADRYPLIVDTEDNVLSFPPIINGVLTEVTTDSKDLFIDMTGTDLKALEQSMNILCTMFLERGAEIHRTAVEYGTKQVRYPDLTPSETTISIDEIRKLLGIDLDEEEIDKILSRMGYEIKDVDGTYLHLKYPAYRHDILHPWDVIEDVAIGFDYDRFKGRMPNEPTIGKPLKSKKIEEVMTELMIGLGFNEVMNPTLSSPSKQFDLMERVRNDEFVRIKNPVSDEGSCLREWLLPSLMDNLKENRNNPLPQKLFEVGDVVIDGTQRTHMAAVTLGPEIGFTKMKSMVDGVLRSVDLDFTVDVKEHPTFVPGRCAAIICNDKEIGYFGEIHPAVLTNFGLEQPASGWELYLGDMIVDPKA